MVSSIIHISSWRVYVHVRLQRLTRQKLTKTSIVGHYVLLKSCLIQCILFTIRNVNVNLLLSVKSNTYILLLIFIFFILLALWRLRNNPHYVSPQEVLDEKKDNHTHLLYVSRFLQFNLNHLMHQIPNKVTGLYLTYLSNPIFTCICHSPSVNSGPWVHTTKISFQWLHAPPVIWQTH